MVPTSTLGGEAVNYGTWEVASRPRGLTPPLSPTPVPCAHVLSFRATSAIAETQEVWVSGNKTLLLGFLLKLLLQLPDLGFQGGDGGLELGLDGALQFLQLGLQLLVLPFQLLARVVALLGGAALGRQLGVQRVHLQRRAGLSGSGPRPQGRRGPSPS